MNFLLDLSPVDRWSDASHEFIIKCAKTLQKNNDKVYILNRGSVPVAKGHDLIHFPSYSAKRFNADDSILIQKICFEYSINLMMSYITTPLCTPCISVYNSEIDLDKKDTREYRELRAALSYCSAILVPGETEFESILHAFPERGDKIIPYSESAKLEGNSLVVGKSVIGVHRGEDFYTKWSALRTLQSRVDTVLWD